MKRKLFIIVISIVFFICAILLLWYYIGKNTSENRQLTVKAKKGDFLISITAPGELEAKSCEYIFAPPILKEIGIWQIKINDIVPEGTKLKKGDYVATLDAGEINARIKEMKADIDKNSSLLSKSALDTANDLRNERDRLASLKFSLEENQVTLDQSKYEPPASIRQAEIELEKSKRAYNQALKNLKFKIEQNNIKMSEINSALTSANSRIESLNKALGLLTVRAPKDGIIIYRIDKDNSKISAGSVVSLWNNIIATMPDMSEIISKTYINEIDINRISINMEAEVIVDAITDRKFSGRVISIANIGMNIPGSQAKVFEVKIHINSFSNDLKPSMSTKNFINLATIKDVIYIPIESVYTDNNTTYVYKKTAFGNIKSQILTGQMNENDIIIAAGVNQNDEIYLTLPENAQELQLEMLKN